MSALPWHPATSSSRPEHTPAVPSRWAVTALASLGQLALPALLALSGCLTAPLTEVDPDHLSGRLAVRVSAPNDRPMRGVSALFDLRSQADAGELELSTPLGTLIGKVQWSPQRVSLLTPQGLRIYPNLSALSEDVLGENIPLQALFDWLNGRPWSGAQATPLPGPPHAGFTQLGWRIQLDQLAQGIIQAHRQAAPEVFIHARLLR